eukprot:gene1306-11390_t
MSTINPTEGIDEARLAKFYGYPIHIAASLLHLSVAEVRLLLKQFGIKRWPYNSNSRKTELSSSGANGFSDFRVNKKQKTTKSNELFGNIQQIEESLKPVKDKQLVQKLNNFFATKIPNNFVNRYPSMTKNFTSQTTTSTSLPKPVENETNLFPSFDSFDINQLTINQDSKSNKQPQVKSINNNKRKQPDALEVFNFEFL